MSLSLSFISTFVDYYGYLRSAETIYRMIAVVAIVVALAAEVDVHVVVEVVVLVAV